MKIEVRVPSLSDSIASGTLLAWRKQPGETVQRDEPLVDLETDKIILEIPAPASGVLAEILLSEGTVVQADAVVATIESGEAATAAKPVEAAPPPPEAKPVPPPPPSPEAKPAPPPTVAVSSAAPERISRPATEAAVLQTASAPPPGPGTSLAGERAGRREPLSRLRRRVAERLVAAQHTAAMLSTFNEVNMQPVNELRQRRKADFETRHGVKLGYMSFFVRAACRALAQYPVVNAAIDGDDIVWHDAADIGIAISTPRGLVVPILRDAHALSAHQIEAAIADFAARAKEGRLALDELAGGTFSITNGGVFGSLLSTPILNPPQSAILGMHAIQDRPVAENGQVVVRPMMYLALTYDHRLIDGRDAVRFLVEMKAALEAPESLLE